MNTLCCICLIPESSLLNKTPPTPTMYKYRAAYNSPSKSHTPLSQSYSSKVSTPRQWVSRCPRPAERRPLLTLHPPSCDLIAWLIIFSFSPIGSVAVSPSI